MNNNFDIMEELIKNPEALYLLYKKHKEEGGFKLPDFMDRGKTFKKLIDFGLAEKHKEKKHLHDGIYKLTQDGKDFVIKNNRKLSFLENISIQKKEIFYEEFNNKLSSLCNNSENDEFMMMIQDLLGKHLGIEYEIQNVKLIIDKIILIDQKDPLYNIDYLLSIKCSRCENKFQIKANFTYNSEEYDWDPQRFTDKCPICSLIFSSDAYLSRWDMYDE